MRTFEEMKEAARIHNEKWDTGFLAWLVEDMNKEFDSKKSNKTKGDMKLVLIFDDFAPEWAWRYADCGSARIACYSGYENAIEFY